ncbi:MAG TPA: preprotein translocase subunit YajC [Turneriella sp.]|nr:preprotein translocase subunit YajC [Turneriella sp.]
MNEAMFTIAQAASVPVTGAPAVSAAAPAKAATTATTSAPASTANQPQPDMSSTLSSFALPVLMIVVFYFLLIRPQQKREKEKRKQLNAMQKGDRVLTAGGIYGTIVGVKQEENLAIVKIADDVKVEVAISTLSGVVTKDQNSK